jgi:hypothetical protein
METKSIGRVALRGDEINEMKRGVNEEYRRKHSLTGVEAFELAKMVSTWQYYGPDPKKAEQVGSYSGNVCVEGIDVAVKLMKERCVGEFGGIEHMYSVTVSTDEFTGTDRGYNVRPMIRELYEQLDAEHNALLKELRRGIEPDTDNNAVKYARTIKGYLKSDN